MGFGVADLVVGLQQQCRGQQTGWHRGAAVVETVEGGKLLVPEQLVAHLRQLPVEAVLAHQVPEVVFRIKQAPLRRPFTQYALHSPMAHPCPSLLTPVNPDQGVSVWTSSVDDWTIRSVYGMITTNEALTLATL